MRELKYKRVLLKLGGGQGTSNSSQGDQGTSGLTPPATAPGYVPASGNDGGAVSTSGGTHS